MKTINNKLRWSLWIAITSLALSHWCRGNSYVIGVSEFYTEAQRPAVLKAVLLFSLEAMAPGDKAVFYDALNLREIATIEMPNEKLFEHNARARATRFKNELAKLSAFFVHHPHTPEMSGVINIPGFLGIASSQLRPVGEPLRIIILGSPIYMNRTEPAFDCVEAFPSDYHILVSERESVWGTATRKRALSGVVIHFGYVPGCFVNDLHQERIGRFLSLYIKQMDGTLASFAPDFGLAIQRAGAGAAEPCMRAEIDPNDTKLEMRKVTPRTLPTWFPSTNQIMGILNDHDTTGSGEQNSSNVVSFPVPDTSGNGLGIGIMWAEAGCDFDLWARARPGSRDLCFASTTSPEGKYFHDYRDKNEGVDYEYIELNEQGLDIAQVKAWVNFYAGHTASPKGVVVIRYKGRAYQATFVLQSNYGNKAAGSAQKNNDCWVELPIGRIIGMR